MKTRLLVLIDFSPYSVPLIKFASDWGDLLKADLVFVHQVSIFAPAMADAESRRQIIENERKEAYTKLKTIVEKQLSTRTSIKYLVTEESLILSLSNLMDTGGNNLIMLGLKGTGFLKNIFLGSTVTKIIEELNTITVAFPKLNRSVPTSFIIALNHKNPLNEKALDNLLQFFKSSLDGIEFISVVAPKDNEDEAKGYLSQLSNRYNNSISSSYKIFKGNKSFDEIKSYMAGKDRSILIVQKGSRSLTDFFSRKFFINEVVYDGSIPLIVLPS